jgi:hypothetical protein
MRYDAIYVPVLSTFWLYDAIARNAAAGGENSRRKHVENKFRTNQWSGSGFEVDLYTEDEEMIITICRCNI